MAVAAAGLGHSSVPGDISGFSPRNDRIFPREALDPFLVLEMKNFRNFVLHDYILVFDAEQVYLKPQVNQSQE